MSIMYTEAKTVAGSWLMPASQLLYVGRGGKADIRLENIAHGCQLLNDNLESRHGARRGVELNTKHPKFPNLSNPESRSQEKWFAMMKQQQVGSLQLKCLAVHYWVIRILSVTAFTAIERKVVQTVHTHADESFATIISHCIYTGYKIFSHYIFQSYKSVKIFLIYMLYWLFWSFALETDEAARLQKLGILRLINHIGNSILLTREETTS